MSNTTAFCYSAKAELPSAAHCFLATVTATSVCTSTTAMTSVASSAGGGLGGIAVGMIVTGTNSGANTVVARLTGAATLTHSVASTGALTAPTFTGDSFLMALIKSGAYLGTQTNYGSGAGTPSVTNLGTDEVANGSGYTTGGFALTNITPAVGTTAGIWSFTTNPSWTSASFTATGAMIYSGSARLGLLSTGVAAAIGGSALNRSISIHDFGGSQTVTSGTFTVLLPTNAQGTSILQIS